MTRPQMDFETYSEAGFEWDEVAQKYRGPEGASQGKKGLPVIGAAKYSEHPSTEVLTLKYDVGHGMKFWRPGMPNPFDLFAAPVVEAWNSGFEYWIWNNVCVRKYGWPARPIEGFYDAMAKSRAHSLPGALSDAAGVLGAAVQKDKDGDRLLKKFSMPRNPTKGDPRRRIPLIWDEDQAGAEVAKLMALGLKEKAATELVQEDRVDTLKLVSYNETDVLAERSVGEMVPDLSRHEFPVWLTDQRINRRGIAIDRDGVDNCIAIIQQASERYGQELLQLAGCKPTELQKLSGWLHGRGVHMESMEEEAIEAALGWDLPPDARRALEIRAAVGSASVKKVFSMRNMMSAAGRLHDLYIYHGAHSGRPTGSGPQPTNLPKAGPHVWKCAACGHQHNAAGNQCPWCFTTFDRASKRREWNPEAVEDALLVLRSRSLVAVEFFFSEAMQTVAGVLRGLFVAKPGHKLVSSDFSSIESVVIAALAGEEWRLDVFRTHGKIYETSAAKILGVPLQELLDYKTQHGVHHPARQAIGKPAELGLGYGGWIGAWKNFGGPGTDEEIKANVLAWRAASPHIVNFWGGQFWRDEYDRKHEMRFGLEGTAIEAIEHPGVTYDVIRSDGSSTGIQYICRDDILFMLTPGGARMTYHRPRIYPHDQSWRGLGISYEGWNTNPKNGGYGWITKDLYGGRAGENCCQHVARNIQMNAIENLEASGYPVVMHTYDEVVCEVPESFGSVTELESLMTTLPAWAKDWPIKAAGGWEARNYRKG